MDYYILFCTIVVFICIVAYQLSQKLGVPTLLLFLLLGMLFGSDGLLKISFAEYNIAKEICSIALVIIIFYGGFNTNWLAARPVAIKAGLLSTVGVLITALIVAVFCFTALHMSAPESFLMGAVISSTDAASVFAILRSKNLNLKDGIASMLEIESGSNDPLSYMLTCIALGILSNSTTASIPYLLFSQVVYGILAGVLFAFLGIFVLKHINLKTNGLDTIFVLSIAFLTYALPNLIGGNGYLGVYIAGIILGNSSIHNKVPLVHFFDALTGLMQILIFFLLGLLAFPSQIPDIFGTAIAITLCLTFLARPLASFIILSPFKVPFKQQLLVSWAGLRGAASIVFAIFAVVSGVPLENDIFHIVFLIALLSVSIQGTLLPYFSKKLDLIGDEDTVLKTFNDYQEGSGIQLIEIPITGEHQWANKRLREITLPPSHLIVMIKRQSKVMVPKGNTLIEEGDILVVSCKTYHDDTNIQLIEVPIKKNHKWRDKALSQITLPPHTLIMMIKRKDDTLIPTGDTVIERGDILILGGLHPTCPL